MKIWNDIGCNLNYEFEFKNIESNSNSYIEFKFNKREMICKSMKKVLEICSSLPSFVTMVLDKNNSKNKQNWNDTIPLDFKKEIDWNLFL
jgi:hypothetical protein